MEAVLKKMKALKVEKENVFSEVNSWECIFCSLHNLTKKLKADLLERAAREAKMKGDRMEEEVEELIRVSQSLEVVN